MFKYLNPNAVAILSESHEHNVDRASLLLYLIDAVTGNVSPNRVSITTVKFLFVMTKEKTWCRASGLPDAYEA